MNKAILPILARLQALQAPARLATGGARIVAGPTDGNRVALLLQEVNQTILGRSLAFEANDGTGMTLEVSGRRVLRLTGAVGLGADADGLLAADVLEDDHKDSLARLLQAFAAPRQEVRVRTAALGRDAGGVSVGLPVGILADLLRVDLNGLALPVPDAVPEPEPAATAATAPAAPAASGPFLRRFARCMGPPLMAWLIRDSQQDEETGGSEEMVLHLRDFLEDEAEALSAQLALVADKGEGPVCLVLAARLAGGHGILAARSGNGILLGVVAGDVTAAASGAWSAALRQ